VVGYPPLAELHDFHRREFHEALLDAASFEDLPGTEDAAWSGEPAVAAEEADWRGSPSGSEQLPSPD
jgi:hypothetical protein